MSTFTAQNVSRRIKNPAVRQVCDKGLMRGAIGLTVISLVGFGFLYSLAGVGLGQVFFAGSASGSLIERDGRVIGSSLVAQPFRSDRYFQPRPSAAGYNAMAMAGSNQARTNPDLRVRTAETRAAVAKRDGVALDRVPGDLITQSGSGIDPHVSEDGARIQIDRVARSRNIDPNVVANLVAMYTEGRQFGVLGQPRVNVLKLNLALDRLGRDIPSTGSGGADLTR